MRDFLASALGTLLPLAIPLSMFNLGLEAGRPHALRLLRRPAALARFVLVTFVVMPAISLLLALLGSLPPSVVEGLLLMSICPPGLGLSQKALKLTGDAEVGLAWQAFAIPLCVVTIPLSVLIIQGTTGVSYFPGASAVLWKVVIIFLIPVALGLAAGSLFPGPAPTLLKLLKPVAAIGQLALLAIVMIVGGPPIVGLGLVPIVVVATVVGVAIVVGHLLAVRTRRRAQSLLRRWHCAGRRPRSPWQTSTSRRRTSCRWS